MENTKQYLTVKETIAYIQSQGYGSVSDQTIRDWCKHRGIGRQFGVRWQVKVSELNRLLEKGFK